MRDFTSSGAAALAPDPRGRHGPAYAPGNAAFRRHHMGRLLHRCGMLLPRWLTGPALLAACRSLEQTCWRELGHATVPLFDGDLPAFLMVDADGRSRALSEPMEPAVLAARLAVAIPSPLPASSPVGTNLERLARLLRLTPFESQWLLWAYGLTRFGPGLLPVIPVADERQCCERLALLCDVPLDVVRDAVAARRLHAWGLLEGMRDATGPSSLTDWLSASYPFVEWIEPSYASDADLVSVLCQAHVLSSAAR